MGARAILTMARVMTEEEVRKRLAELQDWRLSKNSIVRTFEFRTFSEGTRFLNKVAEIAEEQDHHPDIDMRYTRIRFSLKTHSAGGITRRDFRLAKSVDGLARTLLPLS
jgi:4a-hydroxytetrahydrobiopterin dehydratase